MDARLTLSIIPQPDDFTCGPTCLHAVYNYYGDAIPLEQVIRETPRLENGGTLAVMLATHALRRGYRAKIYTYNLQVFDPTWFDQGVPALRAKLAAQAAFKTGHHLHAATAAFLEFLDAGGSVRFEDLTAGLIRRYLNRSRPILVGLSATYLYRTSREFGPKDEYDDTRGEPCGHFVVLCGYDRENRSVLIADPMHPNPVSPSLHYEVNIDRLVCAILLGVLTYDANLLILEPGNQQEPH